MTGYQVYALYGAPVLLVGLGGLAVIVTGWLERRERRFESRGR